MGEGGSLEQHTVRGGWVGWAAEVDKWRYVTLTPRTALPDMMVPRSNHNLAVVQGRLHGIGGFQGTETKSKVEVLVMSSTTWEEVEKGMGRRRLLDTIKGEREKTSMKQVERRNRGWVSKAIS